MKDKKIFMIVPFIFNLILSFILCGLKNLDLVLRNKYTNILFWLLVFSFILVIVYIIILISKLFKKNIWCKIIAGMLDTVLIMGIVGILGLSFLASAFSDMPEHEVVKNGKNVIACVNSFTDVYVYYYEDKGEFFRGREKLGEEWYGSGGYDPFTTEMKVSPKSSTFEK